MIFAMSFGGHLFFVVILSVYFLGVAFRTIASVDDDGEVKKTANEGLARMIGRWLK